MDELPSDELGSLCGYQGLSEFACCQQPAARPSHTDTLACRVVQTGTVNPLLLPVAVAGAVDGAPMPPRQPSLHRYCVCCIVSLVHPTGRPSRAGPNRVVPRAHIAGVLPAQQLTMGPLPLAAGPGGPCLLGGHLP